MGLWTRLPAPQAPASGSHRRVSLLAAFQQPLLPRSAFLPPRAGGRTPALLLPSLCRQSLESWAAPSGSPGSCSLNSPRCSCLFPQSTMQALFFRLCSTSATCPPGPLGLCTCHHPPCSCLSLAWLDVTVHTGTSRCAGSTCGSDGSLRSLGSGLCERRVEWTTADPGEVGVSCCRALLC